MREFNYLRSILYLSFILVSYHTSAQNQKLKLPVIFTDSLVFQQNLEIPVWGLSCPNCRITVLFNEKVYQTIANKAGEWKIKLPSQTAGGPYRLTISDKHSSIVVQDILIGEVWLCSGQSNMEFTLAQSQNGNDEIKNAVNPYIRFFKMTANEKARPVAKLVYGDSLLNEMQIGNFYDKSNWTTCHPSTAAKFSAVAYYFGKELHEKLNVPIGLISNAVGGTTTQSCIYSMALASHPQLVQFIGNNHGKTWLETAVEVHPWVKERVIENLGSNANVKPFLHPFAPAFLFKHGIVPIAPYGIKGVIWYQGESNATHPEIHDALFTSLVKSWRTVWRQGNFPFYTVQLPKISNRSRWPEFRESQRRLSESIENSGMVVTIDTGDSLDVHPREKKQIGYRLSLVALAKSYHRALEYSGPVYSKYELKQDGLYLYFNHANELKANSQVAPDIKGFYLYGNNKSGTREIILEAKDIEIVKSVLKIPIPEDIQLKSLKYAWSPFPICNLINELGLPASPFKIEFKGSF